MGSFTSKDFIDMVEEELPNTPVTNKRLVGLDFDPRSPTTGISRTPIQVEKTPQKVDDPRSPTIGICRTPIVGGEDVDETSQYASSSQYASEGDPSPVSSVNISSGISNCSLSDIQPLSLQAALDSLPPLDLDDSDEEPENQAPEPTKTQSVPAEPITTQSGPTTPTCPLIEQKRNVDREKTPAKLMIDSKLKSASFQVHSDGNDSVKDIQHSPLRVMPDGQQRSPLGKRNIDVSSPRHIVQRKQSNKLSMLKAMANTPIQKSASSSPCRTDISKMEEKENISM